MSNKLIDASLKLKGMSSTCKLVLLVLANSARDDKGGSCWPSISVIAESCCLSDRAVRNALKWLADNGAISAKRQFNSSSVYTVTPEQYAVVEQYSPPEPRSYTPEYYSTTERRSPPEQYSPPEQSAAPPGTTCRTPLNNVPNKLNLNVTETELKKEKSACAENSKPAEDIPDYAKTDTQQPYTDSRTMFEMHADWQPTDSIKPLLGRAGLPTDIAKLDQSRIGDFVNHWFGKPERKTQDGWHGALVGWLKRTQHDKPIQPAGQSQPSNGQPAKPKYDDPSHKPFKRDEPSPGLSPGKLEELKQKARDMGFAV